MRLKLFFIILIAFSNNFIVSAQLNATVSGDAFALGDNCFVITSDILNQQGGVWYDNPIDFDTDFIIYYQNNFGSKDFDGADGMALVFKGDPTAVIGNVGGGLGYEGITPSLVIEFDTYQNVVNIDPPEDHISIIRNADPRHDNTSTNLAGPVQAIASNPNIEDGNTHEVKIEWDAAAQMLSVFFDCQMRLTLNIDVKSTIFSGDDSVFFGFVGSTGGLSNLHQVCFNRISFVNNLQLQDQSICSGSSVQLDGTIPSGVDYSWSPTQGVSNPNIPNPIFSPTTTTTYTVEVSDFCGDVTTEEVMITVQEIIPTFDPIAPYCLGETISPLPTTSNNGITGTWSPALDNTQTTTYTFTPDASQNCAQQMTLDIIINPTVVMPVFDAVSPICLGETISPLPTTSNNGITGIWSPALDNTQTTTYTFTPNVNTCANITTLEIIVNPILTPVFEAVMPICSGEVLSPLPTTSNNGITGIWSPALDNTQTTIYTFSPDSGQICEQQVTLEIIVNPIVTPLFDAVVPICSGDMLTPLPTTSNNGITGIWSPAVDNIQTTTYTFTPSANQCANTTTLEIVVNPIVTPVFDAVVPICSGEVLSPLSTTSNNGITGSWSPALDNTQTATYTFTPDTGQNCAQQITLEIVVNPILTPVFDNIVPICSGEVISPLPMTSNNGITGSWSPAIDNTQTRTYIFTPDTGQICAEQTTLEIVVNPILTPVFDNIVPICSGEALSPLSTTSNNGITGSWSPAIDNTQTTTYTFTPDTSQNCAQQITLEIVVNPIVIPDFDAVVPICSGEVLNPLPMTSNNGISGGWSPAIDNTQTTTYIFTPDSGQICVQQITLEIVVNPIVTPVFDAITPVCLGESLNPLPTTSNNGITGSWSPVLDNTQTMTYTFTPGSGENCTEQMTLEIIVNPIVTPVFDAIDPICSGEQIPVLPTTSNNGVEGVWSPAIDNTQTTTYTFTPSANQCANTTSLEIVVNPIVVPEFDAVAPICVGEALNPLPTTSNNGITGIWSPTLDNTQTTIYAFIPDMGQGCLAEVTLEIIVGIPSTPTFNIISFICEGEFLEELPIISNEGIVGVWTPQLNNLATTTYTFIPGLGQCAEETTQEIMVLRKSELSVDVESVSEAFTDNQTLVASAVGGTGNYEYQLDNGLWQEEPVFNNVFGCEEHVIRVREKSGCSNIAEESFRILEYPKFFTPNNDAVNDTWNIDCLRDQTGAKITIFNRYGKVLTVLYPSRFGWDGLYNNAVMPSSDYWFNVEYLDKNGSARTFASHFTLKR